MAAMPGRDKLDGGIRANFGRYKGCVRDEWIVLGGDHEHGDTDLGGDAFGADVVVIILGIAIAELRSGDDVVKLAYGSDRSKARDRVTLRK